MKRLLLFVILATTFVWFFSIKVKDRPYLLVGTNAEFPPFTYKQEGKIVGFDVDIATEVAHRLGKEIQFKDIPFDTLIADIILDQVDFIAAGLTITEERAKKVLFTKPYLKDDRLVILTNGESVNLKDLVGKTIVVNEGFTADLYLSSGKGFNLVRVPTSTEAFMALKNGNADAFVTAQTTMRPFYEAQPNTRFHAHVIPGTDQTCALIVPKNRPALLVEIQKALDAMEQEGVIAKLKAKWNLS